MARRIGIPHSGMWESSSSSGGRGASGGGAAGPPFGYGPHGYGFAGYGGAGWAGQGNGAGGGGSGTVLSDGCEGYTPATPVDVPTLDSCAAVAQAFEFQGANAGISFSFTDSTPGATENHALVALDPAWCNDADAWHLTISGQASFGGEYEFDRKPTDYYSGADGIALWVRAGQGVTMSFALGLVDGITLGDTVIDPTTGEKACYHVGDDWDLDGQPNLSLPPLSLLCQGWRVNVAVGDQWEFVMLPWSMWSTTTERAAPLGIDASDIRLVQLYVPACAGLDLWMASIGPYRALAP